MCHDDVLESLNAEKTRTDNELQKRQKLLAEAEKLANIGSFEWDIKDNIVTWSDGLYHIYGLNPKEFGASYEAFLNLVHPSCRDMVRKTIETAFQNGEPFEMEEWIVRPDGEVRMLLSKGEVIKGEGGQPSRLFGVCQDITERKQAREREIRQRLLEADNARKTSELEEARKQQLSMLPKKVPELPHLEIAVYMKAATEVGGDYYDFHVADDGILTMAIGDATGHGTRAGMMVTATKALFNVLAQLPEPIMTLKEISRNLKLINLHGLYMSLLIAKFKAGKLRLSAAGMPYALICRAAGKKVEKVVLKGMPLGKFLNFPYKQQEHLLSKGDVVLFMSDGLPDRFNRSGESFGEEQVEALLAQCAILNPQQVIDVLRKSADLWANGAAQNDDVTCIVMKMK